MKKNFVLIVLISIWSIGYAQIVATYSSANVTCFGGSNGSITLIEITGGESPYTYLWSGPSVDGMTLSDIFNIQAGSYSVTITDFQSNQTTQNFTITENSQITITPLLTQNLTCFGIPTGEINISANDGSGNYNYEWSCDEHTNYTSTVAHISSLNAGTYRVTVTDDLGCNVTQAFPITQPNELIISETVHHLSCFNSNDGSIDLDVSGGSSPYFYIWSNGSTTEDINNLSVTEGSSSYDVTVTDNSGCQSYGYYMINNASPIQVQYLITEPTCQNDDGSIVLEDIIGGIGGGGLNRGINQLSDYTWVWSDGSTATSLENIGAGTYSVQVTENTSGCTHVEFITLQNASPLQINTNVINSSCYNCNDGQISLVLLSGTPPYTINWSHGATGGSINHLSQGSYSVTITDHAGCVRQECISVNSNLEMWGYIYSQTTGACGLADAYLEANIYDGHPPYNYLWSTGATTPIIEDIGSGFYGLTVTDQSNHEMVLIGNVSDLGLTHYAVWDGQNDVVCNQNNGSVLIHAEGGSGTYSFLWSNGSTDEDLSNVPSGSYSVKITDGACSSVTQYDVYQTNLTEHEICIVTVDSLSDHNLVVWEPSTQSAVHHYNVFRDDCSGSFTQIGSVAGNAITVFEDVSAQPSIKSYSYAISVVDSCGNESNMSAVHKTIHLEINVDEANGTAQLLWDDYLGFYNPLFKIYKKTTANQWILIDEVNETIYSYIDNNYDYNTVSYAVLVEKTDGVCDAWNGNQARASGGPYYQSTSNIEDEGIIDHTLIAKINVNPSQVYPNPANQNQIVTVQAEQDINSCTLYNQQGQMVRSYQNIQQNKLMFNTQHLPAGLYLIEYQAGETYKQKLVIE